MGGVESGPRGAGNEEEVGRLCIMNALPAIIDWRTDPFMSVRGEFHGVWFGFSLNSSDLAKFHHPTRAGLGAHTEFGAKTRGTLTRADNMVKAFAGLGSAGRTSPVAG